MENHKKLIEKMAKDASGGKISRREFIRSATLLGMSASMAYGIAGVVDPLEAFAQESTKGGTLRIRNRLQPLSDPHKSQSLESSNLTRQVCDYLVRIGVDNVTRPTLLKGWDVSDDIQTWTLHLRDDISWRKGRKFVADDVVWNLTRTMQPETGSAALGVMKTYLGGDVGGLWDANAIEKIDDYTVRLNLKKPQVTIMVDLFNHPVSMIDPEENGFFGVGMNGTGAFSIVEYEPQVKAILEPNPDYWGDGPYIDRLEFWDLGSESSTQLAALSSNQIDGVHSISSSSVSTFEALDDVAIHSVDTAETSVIRGRVDMKPFDDPRVLKALRLAVDSNQVLQVALKGRGGLGDHTHVSPIHPDRGEIPAAERDVEAAKQLLAEAGFPDGLDLELVVRTEPEHQVPAALNLQNQWAEAGIRVEIQTMPATLHDEVWNEVPFGMTPWRHRPLAINALALPYRSGAPWNESRFSNDKFEELLTQAEGIADPVDRQPVLAEIEKLFREEGPIVQPIWRKMFTAYKSNVKGVRLHPTGYIFAEELSIENS